MLLSPHHLPENVLYFYSKLYTLLTIIGCLSPSNTEAKIKQTIISKGKKPSVTIILPSFNLWDQYCQHVLVLEWRHTLVRTSISKLLSYDCLKREYFLLKPSAPPPTLWHGLKTGLLTIIAKICYKKETCCYSSMAQAFLYEWKYTDVKLKNWVLSSESKWCYNYNLNI